MSLPLGDHDTILVLGREGGEGRRVSENRIGRELRLNNANIIFTENYY